MADLGMFPRLLGVVLSPILGLLIMAGIGAALLLFVGPGPFAPTTTAVWAAAGSVVLVVPAAYFSPSRPGAVAVVVALAWLALLVWISVRTSTLLGAAAAGVLAVPYIALASRSASSPESWPVLRHDGPRIFTGAYLVAAFLGTATIGFLFLTMPRHGDSRATKAAVDIVVISEALELFRSETGRYPTSEEGLTVLVSPPRPSSTASLPLLSSHPVDPWGGEYVYEPNGDTFRLRSFGADGLEGGEGADADINSDEILADR